MPYAKANGIDIYYELRGEGYPLVMIMGLSGNIDWWDQTMLALLAEKFQLVIFDNRGAGRSGKPRVEYSIPLMAADTAGLLRSLGIGRAHVLGVSMGGKIAQQLVLDYPDMVERLVLCCTSCGGKEQVATSPEISAQLGARRPGITVEDVARSSLNLLFPQSYVRENPELMEDFIRRFQIAPTRGHAFFGQLAAVAGFGVFARLPEIAVPTLVLTGDSDELVPPENSAILAGNIPGAKLITYKGASHFFFYQFPEAVASDVTFFLGSG
jgi:pimeloyl-ACP methyl ester carboxylesterase